jgi:hypothetical protein
MSDIEFHDANGQEPMPKMAYRNISSRSCCNFVAVLLLATFLTNVSAEVSTEPQKGVAMHLGVVTCAGNTCHGANAPLKDSRVQQNEFIIWHREDKHAKAYTLELRRPTPKNFALTATLTIYRRNTKASVSSSMTVSAAKPVTVAANTT